MFKSTVNPLALEAYEGSNDSIVEEVLDTSAPPQAHKKKRSPKKKGKPCACPDPACTERAQFPDKAALMSHMRRNHMITRDDGSAFCKYKTWWCRFCRLQNARSFTHKCERNAHEDDLSIHPTKDGSAKKPRKPRGIKRAADSAESATPAPKKQKKLDDDCYSHLALDLDMPAVPPTVSPTVPPTVSPAPSLLDFARPSPEKDANANHPSIPPLPDHMILDAFPQIMPPPTPTGLMCPSMEDFKRAKECVQAWVDAMGQDGGTFTVTVSTRTV